MRMLPPVARAFFLSGHGLESLQERQILLPSDFLSPPSPSINDAIGTQNLRYGTASLAINRQIFVLDACRNDHKTFRGKGVTGAPILVEDESAESNPHLVAPVLYATAAGERAWEHRDPAKGISIFGRALLEGLIGRPNIELTCDATRCAVADHPLQKFLKARVLDLMKEAGSREQQLIKLGGTSDITTLTYLEPPAGTKGGAPPAFAVPGPQPAETSLAETTPIRESASDAEFSDRWLADLGEGHRLFGSETITELWQKGTRVWALGGHQWLPANPRSASRRSIATSPEPGSWCGFSSTTMTSSAMCSSSLTLPRWRTPACCRVTMLSSS